ncbi:MAG: SPOR domain-containing protein [Desulfobacterales bacterium]
MTEKPPHKRPARQKSNAPVENSKKGPGFWIGLICFSSIWMFVLGILVGRGTAPVQFDIKKIQDELAVLKHAVTKKEREQFKTLSEAVNNKDDLEFFEDLKASEPVHTIVAAKKPAFEKPDTTATPSIVAEKKAAAAAPPENTAINPETPLKESEYGWTIQVSSLKDRAAAEKMVAKLRHQGYDAYQMASTISGKGIWYRVRVGPFREKKDAESAISRLKSQKYNPLLITL